MIALNIAQHFRDKVRPNGFKAQVVAPSRAAALRYTEQLKSFGLSAYPIITTGHNDGPEFQVARELDPRADNQQLRRPGWRAGGSGSRRHADHRVRRARGAGALPGPTAAGARVVAGHRPRQPPILPPEGRRGDGEDPRPRRGLLRYLQRPGAGAIQLRLARRAGPPCR